MKLNKCLLGLLIVFLLSAACGVEVPPEKSDYIGAWQSKEMYLLILQNGRVRYTRQKSLGKTKIEGPIKEFQGNNFVVGISFFKTTFEVSEPPYQENGQWKMVVDGVKLTKIQ